MKVRYVEAMIQPLVSLRGNSLPSLDDLGTKIADIMGHLGGFEGEDDGREKPSWARVVALAKLADQSFDSLAEAMDEHSCDGELSSPFVPVGSNEDIDTLMRREGFNSADMVAIVKLSDLEALIANQRSVA